MTSREQILLLNRHRFSEKQGWIGCQQVYIYQSVPNVPVIIRSNTFLTFRLMALEFWVEFSFNNAHFNPRLTRGHVNN